MNRMPFNQANPNSDAVLRTKYTNQYKLGRMNLLLLIVMTAVNIIMLITGDESYYLFSATVPYIITIWGMILCGKFPEEFYVGEMEGTAIFEPSVFVIPLVIVLLIVAVYFCTFLFSGKGRVGWLIAALALFSCDTAFLFLFYGIDFGFIMDYVFHIWALVCLILGVRAHFKLKELPEPATASAVEVDFSPAMTDIPDSTPLRAVDPAEKARTLLEVKVGERSVVYRRVKRTNELVIDGQVYAEYKAFFELAHQLTARIDGHEIAVGLNPATSVSYCLVDGQVIMEKLRVI